MFTLGAFKLYFRHFRALNIVYFSSNIELVMNRKASCRWGSAATRCTRVQPFCLYNNMQANSLGCLKKSVVSILGIAEGRNPLPVRGSVRSTPVSSHSLRILSARTDHVWITALLNFSVGWGVSTFKGDEIKKCSPVSFIEHPTPADGHKITSPLKASAARGFFLLPLTPHLFSSSIKFICIMFIS